MGIGPNYASREDLLTAANLLRPLIASGQASRGAKLAQADILQNLAHHLSAAEGARLCEESRQILADMGALNLSDLAAAGIYGDVTDSQSRMEQVLGRLDEAQRLSELVGSLAEKVLAQRPGDLRAMKNRFYSADLQSRLAEQRHDYAKARTLGEASVTACRNYILFNPEDSSGWEALGLALMASGNLQMEEGRVSDALQTFRTAATLHQDPRNKTGISSSTTWAWGTLVRVEAQSGYLRSAQESLAELRKVAERWPKERGFAKSEYVKILQVNTAMAETNILLAAGDYAAAHQLAAKSAGELDALQLKEKDLEDTLILSKRLTRSVQVEASLRLGNAEEAATLLQDFIKKPLFRHNQDDLALKADLQARAQVQLGRALTASGQMDEARRVLGEAEKHYRELQKQGERGTGFTRDFTQLLYRLALAQPEDAAGRARRKALLAEAAQQFGTLSFEVQQLKDFRELADWIQTAQRSASQEATQ
jgi:tetratricopeptide (TPR) repeat protein